ncbi:MAG: DUF1189 family protein [Candidatus Dojkabacteria bacterium]|jgi:hypothetical protein|nr:DUF1189 family protein [Candidatus Dojkabacteria bacterium]
MTLFRAIYDRKLYQESLSQKFRKPFTYWTLISIISILVYTLSMTISVRDEFPSIQELKDSIPYFEINDGILNIDERVEFLGEDSIVLIIDDDYVFQKENFQYVTEYIVATRDSVYIKGTDTELQQLFYKDLDMLKNTNKDILLDTFLGLIPTQAIIMIVLLIFLFFLLIVLVILGAKFAFLLLYALVGLLTAKIFKKQLSYSQSLKIVLYGSILPTLVGTGYWLIFGQGINGTLLFILITVYTGFFISQLKTENTLNSPNDLTK